jgi:hypothetical protein
MGANAWELRMTMTLARSIARASKRTGRSMLVEI